MKHGKYFYLVLKNITMEITPDSYTNYFKDLEDGINTEHLMVRPQKTKSVRYVSQNGETFISHTHLMKKIEIFTMKSRTGEIPSEIKKTKKYIALTHIIENFL